MKRARVKLSNWTSGQRQRDNVRVARSRRQMCARAFGRVAAPMMLVAGGGAALFSAVALAAPSESRFVLVSVADRAGQPALGLEPDDFTVENGGVPCHVVGITPASYPLAIILDTSNSARTAFPTPQLAGERLPDRFAAPSIAPLNPRQPGSPPRALPTS